jgi:hypothetical protein
VVDGCISKKLNKIAPKKEKIKQKNQKNRRYTIDRQFPLFFSFLLTDNWIERGSTFDLVGHVDRKPRVNSKLKWSLRWTLKIPRGC